MPGITVGTWVVRNHSMLTTAAWIIAFLILIIFMQNKDAEANDHAAYVKELEKLVTKCTNQGDNPIIIDGEIYLCGAARTGIKAKP